MVAGRPEGPPDGGGVGESRPVKEGSRGRPGRHRVETMPDRGRKDGLNGERRQGGPMYPSLNDGGDLTRWQENTEQDPEREMEEVRRMEGVRSNYSAARRNTFKGEGVMHERTGSRKWKKVWRRRLRAEE